jgi:prepilin-type N-terminal cleavage/methylation domain-containing protein
MMIFRKDNGFSLIELIVSIGIVGLLLSLSMPAIQSAREAARSLQCANQLRQLSLGIQNHVSRLGRLPGNGGDQDDSLIANAAGTLVPIGTHDLNLGVYFRWGVGRPGARPQDQPGCWAYAILPDIEQSAVYQSVSVESAGPMFLCPSRSRGGEVMVPSDDANGRYEAADRKWAKTDFASNSLVIANRPVAMSTAEITDGLSHTIALGEKAFDPMVQTPSSWYWDEPIFSGGSRGTSRSGLLLHVDGVGIEYKHHWGSAHPAGVHFTMFDGSVQMVTRLIDWKVFRSSLSPRGGEVEVLGMLP